MPENIWLTMSVHVHVLFFHLAALLLMNPRAAALADHSADGQQLTL